ncbi:MAG TPA: DUF308 domain-containing protein [Nitrososphaeraceae archaeon]|nr:DUF308 domain-containing protein [Nitrososphaeraceae archaeon]
MSILEDIILSLERSPAWVRPAQIGLGIIVVILSIYALAYPGAAFVSIVFILGIILFIVGIEKIIAGIFLPIRGKGASIGLGILVLIFAGLVIAYPEFATWIITIFIGIALLFGGAASIAQAFSGKESGWRKAFLLGVGALLIAIGIMVLVSPVFGAQFAGFIVAIALLIAGIQMIVAGATGRKLHLGTEKLHK